jgi:hypothetical protein
MSARLRLVAALLGGLLFAPTVHAAEACGLTTEVPESLQVAWVSRIGARAGAHTALPVVRVSDLRRLVESSNRDATTVLRALGMVGKRGEARGGWKVTIFDVKRDWLCRPVLQDSDDGPAVATIVGMAACPGDLTRGAPGVRGRAWAGGGYLLDTATGKRSLDVYRVEWSTAVAWGFCVLPLRRFLDGA